MAATLTDQAQEVLTLLGQASEPVKKQDIAFQKAVTNFCNDVIAQDSRRDSQMVPERPLL